MKDLLISINSHGMMLNTRLSRIFPTETLNVNEIVLDWGEESRPLSQNYLCVTEYKLMNMWVLQHWNILYPSSQYHYGHFDKFDG
ncbi:hypothetical protein EAI_01085 [Harpegnathos saltator]|uniref:Uncharacterized protein n=1 Tax=Harpegnathos saltator TaxID=610380 RepID=E2B901_HARSA|nr:hypothetical protein EAI_01085 [Harpegnathos saltator]